MEEQKKKDRAPQVVVGILLLAFLACVVLLVVQLANRWEEQETGGPGTEQMSRLTPEPTIAATKVPEATATPTPLPDFTVSEFEYDVFRCLGDVYIIRKSGCYGMADLEGNCLVEPVYNKWVYFDQDWVSFEDAEEVTHVFDRTGKHLYEYKFYQGQMTNSSGQSFLRALYYRHGMKIEYDYNENDNYYGIHYYNAETGELIFELTDELKRLPGSPAPDVLVTSLPDETGTAVVIGGNGYRNTMYVITKDGYTSEEYIENYVERRFFIYSEHNVWNRTNLYNGWLFTTMIEERGRLLDYSEEWTDVFYNIHTKERVPLPEEYQDWYSVLYQYSKGEYYGISGESAYAYDEDLTDYMYYAICHGSKKLTEEIYQWINFGETYIIAGNNSFSHILDYKGNVLAEYKDIAFPFVDGRTLVCDDTGAFFIDETLERCSGYVMENVDYCHPGFIRKGNDCYLVKWIGKE